MSIEQRVETVEEAILIMKNLLVNHNDRLDDYFEYLNRERLEREEQKRQHEEWNENFEFKMNALIDSQIKNEEAIIELRKSTTELKEASQSHLQRIENLEDKN